MKLLITKTAENAVKHVLESMIEKQETNVQDVTVFCAKPAWKLYMCTTCYNDLQKLNKEAKAIVNDSPSSNLSNKS
ncbi:unnamed protein product [Brachionus calyciflorus]|uniref:Uncharacterized protein n=1 Tax=Brachionus calyciflorus TaxID=104777 RepID=A0A814J8K8_9BILA|nr:unnamed protein product [Brachionus calyciflorus]